MKRIISIFLTIVMILGLWVGLAPIETHALTVNQQNIVDRANYMWNATWVCKKTITAWNSTFYAGNTYHIPYGQPINSGYYIGYGVSVDTYLAAAADANSVFYTKQSWYSGTKAPYYANDCSAFVSWCWGTSRYTTYGIPNISTYIGAANSSNISNYLKVGDCLNSASHVVLITGITYSGSSISSIEVTEQTPPQLKKSTYTVSGLASKYSGSYSIYRYEGTVPAAPDGSSSTESSISIGVTMPAENQVVSQQSQSLQGTITSNYAISSVVAYLDGSYLAESAPGATSFSLEDSAIDYALPFATLSTGQHTLELVVTDSKGVSKSYTRSFFSGTTESLRGVVTIDITMPAENQVVSQQSQSLQGTITSTYSMSSVMAYLDGSYIAESTPEATSFSLEDSAIDYALPFATLSTGQHTLKLVVTDVTGNTYNLTRTFYSGSGGSGGSTSEYTGGTAGDGYIHAYGVDVSEWQGTGFDFQNLKDNGIEFVIIRCGFVKRKDYYFEEFYSAAKAAGLDVGTYFYSYATTAEEAAEEADICLSYIEGKQFEYPVYFDFEDPDAMSYDSTLATNICRAFMDKVAAKGYLVGLYSMASWFDGWVPVETICKNYESWAARVVDGTPNNSYSTNYPNKYGMYQYDFEGYVGGVGPLDLDVAYKDYPAIVKQYGFNGYSASNNPTGYMDSIGGGKGTVSLSGWAYDADSSSESLAIHVYIGGDVGVGEYHAIDANLSRTDVNSAYGITGNHGFSATLSTEKTGEQQVYVYMINVGGGSNTLLGIYTVTISIYENIGDSFYARIYNSEYDKYVSIDSNGEPFADTKLPDQSQVWKFERMDENNAYKITNTKNNLLLDLQGGDATLGTNIITYQDVSSDAQRWYLTAANDGYILIPKAAPDNAMDIDTGSQQSIACWNNYSGVNQTFQIVTVSSIYELSAGEPANLGDTFCTYLYNSEYGKYVGLVDSEPTALAKADDNSQLWRFDRIAEDGSYKITNLGNGKVLDLVNEDDTPGTNIITYTDTGSWAQRWYIVPKNDGYVLQCKAAKSNAFDIDTGGQTGIACWAEYGGVNQTFQINKLGVVTVNHYVQKDSVNISDVAAENYTLESSEFFIAEPNDTVTVDVKTFSGRITPSKIVTALTDDNSTVVNYYYGLRYGDINCDETVDSTDMIRLMRRLIDDTADTDLTEALSDINGDGKVSLSDLLRLKLHLADSSVKMGIECEKSFVTQNQTPPENLGDEFSARINYPAATGLNLSIYGDSSVITYTASTSTAQIWNFTRQSDGSYKIVNSKYSKCLTVSGGVDTDGTDVTIADDDGSDAQLWYIYAANGGYRLVPKCATGSSLDVSDGSTMSEAFLQIWTSNDNAAQVFDLEMVE